ncbi:TPA: hypothetical protein DCZ39_00985 [Patescibacteria group bacterium]|nr:hypothetical protein [Candidatus Gracilibacteria bacterium]
MSIYNEFMANHTYYQGMLASRANRKLVIWSVIAVCIPIVYIIRSKMFSLKKFFVYILPLALITFTLAFTLIKDNIIG